MPPTRSFSLPPPVSRRRIRIPSLRPTEQAELEVMALSARPEYQSESVFGGRMPADMLERNKKKAAAFQEARAKIIAKHRVIGEYLVPLYEQEQHLQEQLDATRAEIAVLRTAQAK